MVDSMVVAMAVMMAASLVEKKAVMLVVQWVELLVVSKAARLVE